MALAVAVTAPAVSAAGAKTKLVSKANGGGLGNGGSEETEVSGNGRFVVFESNADNLVNGDSNGRWGIFTFDRRKNKTKLISKGVGGSQANGDSFDPSISLDGRYVLFTSEATNIVNGDGNNRLDVFIFDRKTGKRSRISVSSAEAEASGDSWNASISANGRFVAFGSESDDLVASDNNGQTDVFLRDRKKGKTKIISVRSNGAQGDSSSGDSHISANGRFVVFSSDATNLVASDNNGQTDVFLRDRKKGKTKIISVRSNGKRGNGDSEDPVVSSTGRFVAFASTASNFKNGDTSGEDVFVHDRATKKTKMVSINSKGRRGNAESANPSISLNGRWVVFQSDAENLVRNDSNLREDVFMRDRASGKTKRISVKSNGNQGNGDSDDPWISGDGRWVGFESSAENFVSGDNGEEDVFIRGRVN